MTKILLENMNKRKAICMQFTNNKREKGFFTIHYKFEINIPLFQKMHKNVNWNTHTHTYICI